MLSCLRIVIRGAGDLATGVALRLHRSGFTRLAMLERANPVAVRRRASFCEAVRLGEHSVEGVTAQLADNPADVELIQSKGRIPVLVDPQNLALGLLKPDVLVDAVIAKRNLGTTIHDAPLVIGLGPGFTAGQDVHRVVETHRGIGLGRVIASGAAQPNTGVPASVMGYASERVLRAPADGIFTTGLDIGHMVSAGQSVGVVAGEPVISQISGVLRGLLPHKAQVAKGMKLGDVDPRGHAVDCARVSDKALAIGGGVLEAILERYNTGPGQCGQEEGAPWPSATP
ncbi:MAG: selenium-dependent molybdenum cofactor biosynthesis protein YqeB [Acidobacteriota bacterium]